MSSYNSRKLRTESYFELMDYRLIVPVILITLIGLYVLNIVLSLGYGSGIYPGNFKRQLIAVLIGVVLASLISLLDSSAIKLFGYLIYSASVVLLIYVKIDGYVIEETGSDSWVQLPFVGNFQPSELAKAAIVILVANHLGDIRQGKTTLFSGLLKAFGIAMVPLFLIIREPDFGSAFVIIVMLTAMVFVWGIARKYILMAVSMIAVALPLMWIFYFADYQKQRIITFIFPSHDNSDNYHLNQALKAISSGGLAGNAFDTSVPVKESDFIFTAVAEKTGLIGVIILLGLIIYFMVHSISLAYRVSEMDFASSYLVVGLTAGFAFHFIENMGMNIGLMPITGIPLPFVSYGGSSMIVNYIAVGVMLNVSMNYRQFIEGAR